jgi:hypothetical protein
MTTMKSWLIGKFHHHQHQLVNAPNAGGVTDSFQQGIMKEKRGVHFPKIVNEDDVMKPGHQKSHAASSSSSRRTVKKPPTTPIPRITVEDDDNLLQAVGSTATSKNNIHPRLSKSEMNLTNSSSSLLPCESNSSLSHPPASSSSIPRLLAEVIRQATTTTARKSCDLEEEQQQEKKSRAGVLIRVISGRDPSVQSQLLFNPRRTSQPWHNLVRDLARAVNVNGNLSRIQTLYGRKVNHITSLHHNKL